MKSLPHARLLLALSLALLGTSALALHSRLAPVRAEVRTSQAASHLRAAQSFVVAAQGFACADRVRLQARPSLNALAAQRVERADRRARFERAPLHSRRLLLPQFVIVYDAPDDEDLADLRAERVRYYPEDVEPSLDEVERSPRLPPRALLERPPRA